MFNTSQNQGYLEIQVSHIGLENSWWWRRWNAKIRCILNPKYRVNQKKNVIVFFRCLRRISEVKIQIYDCSLKIDKIGTFTQKLLWIRFFVSKSLWIHFGIENNVYWVFLCLRICVKFTACSLFNTERFFNPFFLNWFFLNEFGSLYKSPQIAHLTSIWFITILNTFE